MNIIQGRSVQAGVFAAIFAMMAVPGMAQESGPASDSPGNLMAELKNSYIFVFNDSVRGADASGRAYGLAYRHGGTVEHVYSTAIRGFSAHMSAEAAARMAARNPEIAYYEADGLVWAVGGNMNAAAGKPVVDNSVWPQVTPPGITRVGGPAIAPLGSTAWVLDTGIDLDHPDLNVDVERSRKFAGGRDAGDRNGHGTHVAGIIGALDNEYDVVGVAPGVTLVSVRVLRKNGFGRNSGIIAGLDYVAANAKPGVDVVNMSLSGGPSDALDAAVVHTADLGILFAVAAGNERAFAGNYSPARVEHPNVYTVSAVDQYDNFASSFSNWGNPPVDFAAPGVGVFSLKIDGGKIDYSGTSMAAPHVAGVLLVTGGMPKTDGCALGDTDGKRDPIVHIDGGASCSP